MVLLFFLTGIIQIIYILDTFKTVKGIIIFIYTSKILFIYSLSANIKVAPLFWCYYQTRYSRGCAMNNFIID